MVTSVDKGSLLISLSAWTRTSFSWNGFSGNEQDLKGDGQVDDDTYFHFYQEITHPRLPTMNVRKAQSTTDSSKKSKVC